jgi:tRNA (cmo5U34)-methyltransferase
VLFRSVEATDFAPGMLAQCAEALAAFGDRVTFRELDFSCGELGSRFDVVLAGLSIHHLQDEGKRALIGRIGDALVPGGVFVIREFVAGDTPQETARDEELWRAFMDGNGVDGAALVERARREDIPATVDAHLRWMREGGLVDERCSYRRFQFAVMSARKPAA